MAELTKEICKYKRGNKNVLDITQEIADVEIMLMQLKMMLDIWDDDVKIVISRKLARLEVRMEGLE